MNYDNSNDPAIGIHCLQSVTRVRLLEWQPRANTPAEGCR